MCARPVRAWVLRAAALAHGAVSQELESIQKLKKEPGSVPEAAKVEGDKDYKPHGLAQREAQGAYSRRSKRIMKEVRASTSPSVL